MPVQRTCVSARGTGSGRLTRPSEVQALLVELANLRDVLTGITDRLRDVEVHVDELTLPVPASLLSVPAISDLARFRFGAGSGRVVQLRELRLSRGWTQSGLIHRLRCLAAQEGVAVPEADTLKTMLSRWENGRCSVGQFYLALFGRLFEQHPATVADSAVEAVAA